MIAYGKSIKRDVLEGEFSELLHAVQPSEPVMSIAERMLRKWWITLHRALSRRPRQSEHN